MWRKLATRLNSRMQQGETSLAGLSPFAGRVVHPLVLVAAAAAVAWQLRQQAASSVSVTAGLVHESRGSSIALQGAPPAACLVIHCWPSGRGGCCHGWAWQSSAAIAGSTGWWLPVLSMIAKVLLSKWPCLLQWPVWSPSGTAGCCRRGIAADVGRPLAALLVTASAWEEGAGFLGCHPVCS